MEKVRLPCPNCKSDSEVVKIVFGRPGPDLLEQANQGKVHLGGCCPDPLKEFHCKKCDKSFGTK